jgi:hypothetical protein
VASAVSVTVGQLSRASDGHMKSLVRTPGCK